MKGMTKKQKTLLTKILVSAVLYAVGLLLPFETAKIIIFIAAYAVVGYSVIIKAAKNIAHGQVFDENFLMLVATIGAFGLKDFAEAVAVMLFYQVGELFEKGQRRDRRSYARRSGSRRYDNRQSRRKDSP